MYDMICIMYLTLNHTQSNRILKAYDNMNTIKEAKQNTNINIISRFVVCTLQNTQPRSHQLELIL